LLRRSDIARLRFLISSRQKQNQSPAIVSEIDSITWAEKETQLVEAVIDFFLVAKLSFFQPSHPRDDSHARSFVERPQPILVRAFVVADLESLHPVVSRLEHVVLS
jgi:hypothetical protein